MSNESNTEPTADQWSAAAQALGRRGGRKGGKSTSPAKIAAAQANAKLAHAARRKPRCAGCGSTLGPNDGCTNADSDGTAVFGAVATTDFTDGVV